MSDRDKQLNCLFLCREDSMRVLLLDSATLQHVPGEITTDIGDRIEQYTALQILCETSVRSSWLIE